MNLIPFITSFLLCCMLHAPGCSTNIKATAFDNTYYTYERWGLLVLCFRSCGSFQSLPWVVVVVVVVVEAASNSNHRRFNLLPMAFACNPNTLWILLLVVERILITLGSPCATFRGMGIACFWQWRWQLPHPWASVPTTLCYEPFPEKPVPSWRKSC
jgi:hypothetical protein